MRRTEIARRTSNNAQGESQSSSKSNRHLSRIVPSLEVVVGKVALAEQVVFDEHDDEEGSGEVSEQGQKVFEIGQQLIPTCETEQNDCNEAE
jgi:hypothetical protein